MIRYISVFILFICDRTNCCSLCQSFILSRPNILNLKLPDHQPVPVLLKNENLSSHLDRWDYWNSWIKIVFHHYCFNCGCEQELKFIRELTWIFLSGISLLMQTRTYRLLCKPSHFFSPGTKSIFFKCHTQNPNNIITNSNK